VPELLARTRSFSYTERVWRGRLVIAAFDASRRRRSATAALGLLGCVAPRLASAAEMRFEAPSNCGTAADFRRQLAALAGSAVAIEPSLLQIRAEAAGYRLRLELGAEVRELVDSDCPALLRSAAVISAAAARAESAAAPDAPAAGAAAPPAAAPEPPALPATPAPALVPAEPSSTPPPPAAPAAAPSPAPTSAAAPPAAAPASRPAPPAAARAGGTTPARARELPQSAALPPFPARFAVSAGVGLTGGVLPGASALLELRAGLEPAPVGAALSAYYWPGSSTDQQGRSLDLSGLGARATALIALGAPVRAGVGLEVDRLSGSAAAGVAERGSDAAWRLAASLELNAIPWSIGRLRIELGAAAQLALIRPRFLVTGFGAVYRVPDAGGAAIIRGVWLFP
jgi:hypothetical protein